MGLEDIESPGKYLDDLDSANPVGATDTLNETDNHLRGIKNVLKLTFPNITGPITSTQTELNLLTGKTSLNFIFKDQDDTMSGILTFDKTYNEKVGASLGTGGAIAVDTSLASFFYTGTLLTDPTFTFTNPPASGRGRTITIELNDAAAVTVTWPGTVVWPNGVEPSWSNGKDIVSFTTRDGGATWLGFFGGRAFS